MAMKLWWSVKADFKKENKNTYYLAELKKSFLQFLKLENGIEVWKDFSESQNKYKMC